MHNCEQNSRDLSTPKVGKFTIGLNCWLESGPTLLKQERLRTVVV